MDETFENQDKLVIKIQEFKEPLPVGKKESDFSPSKNDKLVQAKLKQKFPKIEEVEHGKKSHFEFMKIMKETKDPLKVEENGGLKGYKMEEIKKHNNENSLWMVLDEKVFDLTMYLDYHPGGPKKLLSAAGKDGMPLFSNCEIN